MARKPLPSYDNLALPSSQPSPDRAGEGASLTVTPAARRRQAKQGGTTLKERSAHVMLYITPESWLAIKRYALESDQKPHDVLVGFVRQGLDGIGINVPVRVPSRDRDETD